MENKFKEVVKKITFEYVECEICHTKKLTIRIEHDSFYGVEYFNFCNDCIVDLFEHMQKNPDLIKNDEPPVNVEQKENDVFRNRIGFDILDNLAASYSNSDFIKNCNTKIALRG